MVAAGAKDKVKKILSVKEGRKIAILVYKILCGRCCRLYF